MGFFACSRRAPLPQAALSAALLVWLGACATPSEPVGQAGHSIVGGEPASASFAAIAALVASDSGRLLCSGVLIHPDLVLSAGHCIAPAGAARREPEDVLVVIGAGNVMQAEPGRVHAVQQMLAPFFDGQVRREQGNNPEGLGDAGDIGLLRLSAPVTDVSVEPLLPSSIVDEALSPGARVTIGGYGFEGTGASSVSGERRIADTGVGRRNATEFAAGGAGQPDSCTGDSGGPAFVTLDGRRFMAGVASRGFPDRPECGEGGIYTLAAAYEDWIAAEISNAAASPAPAANERGCSIAIGPRASAAPPVFLILGIIPFARRRHLRRRELHSLTSTTA